VDADDPNSKYKWRLYRHETKLSNRLLVSSNHLDTGAGRWINHSSDESRVNCKCTRMSKNGHNIAVSAIRPIQVGEELF